MKMVRVLFECENDVFAKDMADAISDVFYELSRRAKRGDFSNGYDKYQSIRDGNGNTIGAIRFKDESDG